MKLPKVIDGKEVYRIGTKTYRVWGIYHQDKVENLFILYESRYFQDKNGKICKKW